MFAGEALDTVANVLAWVVLIVVPIVGIAVFWLVHILPEKVAEKKRHPQAKAIQVLCLLSLVFGGLLWPLAWLWAYSKPVMYKMAYGTDVSDDHGARRGVGTPAAGARSGARGNGEAARSGSRPSRRRPARRLAADGTHPALIYSFFAWLVFFKFKWLPWNITTQVITITIPIIGITT